MTLTAIVGALVALVPAFRPKGDKVKERKPYVSKDPLIAFTAMLERGIARRDGEIEDLNRDLAIQRALVDHWKGQARILAQALRREREGPGSEAQRQMAYAQAAQALQNQQYNQQLAQQNAPASLQAQHYASMVPSPLGQGQLGQQFGLQQHGAFEGFCNCVPSRAQVWGASHGLVGQLNDFLGE